MVYLYNFMQYTIRNGEYLCAYIKVPSYFCTELIPELIYVKNLKVIEYVISRKPLAIKHIIHFLVRTREIDYELLEFVINASVGRCDLMNILSNPGYTDMALYRDFLNVKFPDLKLFDYRSSFNGCIVTYLLPTCLYELIQYVLPHCETRLLEQIRRTLKVKTGESIYYTSKLVDLIDTLL